MDDRGDSRRTLYWLRVVEKYRPVVQSTPDRSAMLLRIAAGRTLRLPGKRYENMLSRGMIACEADGTAMRLSLTGAGRATMLRLVGGGYSAQHQRREPLRLAGKQDQPATMINLDESPLRSMARLRAAGGGRWFAASEIAAAERLRFDFEKALMQPRITASWDPTRVTGRRAAHGGARDLSDDALAARARINAAIAAIGPELAGATLDVCCFLKGLEQVERERGWPRRSAKLMLRTALGILGRHYNPRDDERPAQSCIRHWGGDGYRPQVAE